MRRFMSFVVIASVLCTLCSCGISGKVPVVRFEDNVITVNGKVIAEADYMYVNRLDEQAISLSTSEGFINLNSKGEKIELKDVITDREYYEAMADERISDSQFIISVSDLYPPSQEYDIDAAREVLSSYDTAMELDFYMTYAGVTIITPKESGGGFSITLEYDPEHINPKYCPGDGIACESWMRGRVAYGISDLFFDGYVDHWACSSLRVSNFSGKTYLWFCIEYEDENGDNTYYSVVAEEEIGSDYKMVYSKEVDGPFTCSDIGEFSDIIAEIET